MSLNKLNKKLGFGTMRLKMKDKEVDYDEFCNMIDIFIKEGFNYFDTSRPYIGGKSELAIRDCLVKRYNREDYVLANKFSEWIVKKEDEILPFFESQLKACGVDYFDFYFYHAVDRENYPRYKNYNSFKIIRELKEQGKVRHIAISFHDTADILDMILKEQPDIEVVQLQLNYLDYDDPTIQSRACYDVAVKHGKKVMVMEPVKGGALADLPQEAERVLDSLGSTSYASYALRFAAEHPQVIMVLSGMGSIDMMKDNIKTMSNALPLDKKEHEALVKVRDIIRQSKQIPCTSCNYCKDVCPQHIAISKIFSAYNSFLMARTTANESKKMLHENDEHIFNCIKCGKCESICPQNIEIRKKLENAQKDLS